MSNLHFNCFLGSYWLLSIFCWLVQQLLYHQSLMAQLLQLLKLQFQYFQQGKYYTLQSLWSMHAYIMQLYLYDIKACLVYASC